MTDAAGLLVSKNVYPSLLPKARMQVDRITGERTLLYPEGMLVLNPTSAAILDLCDGTRSVQGVIDTLAALYEAPAEEVEADVVEYMQRLNSKCLLALNNEARE